MTRLIDADALKESIDEHVYLVHHGFNETEYGCTQYGIHQIIDDAPTIDAVPRWIPVSERLPKVRQWVLCQCRAGIMDVLRLTADGSWDKGYPHTEYMGGFVVAWMPLPKPYEGDKE